MDTPETHTQARDNQCHIHNRFACYCPMEWYTMTQLASPTSSETSTCHDRCNSLGKPCVDKPLRHNHQSNDTNLSFGHICLCWNTQQVGAYCSHQRTLQSKIRPGDRPATNNQYPSTQHHHEHSHRTHNSSYLCKHRVQNICFHTNHHGECASCPK